MPEYNYAVYLFALSTVLELACEPLWVLAETQFFVKLKVVVTGCALASRCLVTVVLLYMMPGLGLYAFCLAQLTQSVVFLAGYYGYFIYAIQKGRISRDKQKDHNNRELI
jgi:oligosaccharide translocation protein RFT1